MQCAACGQLNREGRNFCGGCGARLVPRCTACGATNEAEDRFCGGCGAQLGGAPAPVDRPPAAREAVSAAAAERRLLTVMFCDLVDSTPLSERLDPEELREVVRAYQAACAEVIVRSEGHIAQYLGDGLLVYFGFPQAHEDDARRAVRTALGILAGIDALNRRLTGVELGVRLGIHTGLVVVGDVGAGGRHEQLALGETPNIAARLQSLAAPGSIAVSGDTARLARGYFELQPLGMQSVKGLSRPIEVFRVDRETAAVDRLDASDSGFTPFVGRAGEVALLRERWEQAKDGVGQVVLLSGEAGIGKSRLVRTLKEYLADEQHARVELRCSPYHQSSAFYPVSENLRRLLDFKSRDTAEQQLAKLEAGVGAERAAAPELVPLLAELLSLPHPASYPVLNLAPEQRRQRTLEGIIAWVLRQAAEQPLLVVVEDLHWVDPSTLELLGLLLEQLGAARILVLLTFRPEFEPAWRTEAPELRLTLSRLPPRQAAEMVRGLTVGRRLPAEVLEQMLTRADGVPLFVEELTKMVLESNLAQADGDRLDAETLLLPLGIPTTLQGSLMARLDRLSTIKETAQLAAVLGREFRYELLRAVSPLEEPILRSDLERLAEAELLYRRGIPPEATYSFKHALIQEAAYGSLLRSRRQEFHQQIAAVLERQFPEIVRTQPELIARHYTEAQLPAQAISYWYKAGEQAAERSANLEALAHLRSAFALLRLLPASSERDDLELSLQVAIAGPLMAAQGPGAPETLAVYSRARELCGRVGNSRQLFSVLRGLSTFYLSRDDLTAARELAEQMLAIAVQANHRTLLLGANLAIGQPLLWSGDLEGASKRLEAACEYYDPERHRPRGMRAGQDPAVVALSYLALALCVRGELEQAEQRSVQALELARRLDHPLSLASAMSPLGLVRRLLGDAQTAAEYARVAIEIGEQHGFPMWVGFGLLELGAALVQQGVFDEGITRLTDGLAGLRRIGHELVRTPYLPSLAQAYAARGEVDAGFATLAEAMEIVARTGEHFYEAELFRVRGELRLASAPDRIVEAMTDFHRALEIARAQQASVFELRAALSLCRRVGEGSEAAGARTVLAGIQARFDQHRETPDLLAARGLLEATAGGAQTPI